MTTASQGGEEHPPSEAEEAYAAFLDDPRADFEALCAAHPALAPALRELHRDWGKIEGVVRELGVADSGVERIAPRFGNADPGITLRPEESDRAPPDPDLLERLSRRDAASLRYRIRDEIGRGGMGSVLRVWDADLRRSLAMKVLHPEEGREAQRIDPGKLNRFLEEAQITGQLDHPGVVPVHEVGVDPEGRVYFTMRLVRGRTLGEIFALVRKRREGWTQTRALGVLLKVCDAMAFAHTHNVVHRDLKPANIMVGRFGEVYVMDWGLATVPGQTRARVPHQDIDVTPLQVWTDRMEQSQGDPAARLFSMDGAVVGTPAYMAPEQARGDAPDVGPAADVYSVGAILYELLSGHMPYAVERAELSAHAVWRLVLEGPPRPVDADGNRLASELVAICERAMARDREERYPSMAEMAEDLRAFLENRVVRAHRTGPFVEFQKWVVRNKAVAASLAALLVVIVSASLVFAWLDRQRLKATLRTSDLGIVEQLLAQVAELGSIHPDQVEGRMRWLQRARKAIERRDEYADELETIRRSAFPADPALLERDRREHPYYDELATKEARLGGLEEELARLRITVPDARERARERSILEREARVFERRVARLRPLVDRRRRWEFEDAELQGRHDILERLVASLERLGHEQYGAIARVANELELARTLRERSVDAHSARWSAAIASIADPALCPAYEGLGITPQVGLVPLWRASGSGLWEFWVMLTGEEPKRAADGSAEIGPDTGVVLVLLPHGHFVMGAQSDDIGSPNYDPAAHPSEGPLRDLELAPFFLAKHEMTQGQWIRITDENPSMWSAGSNFTDAGQGVGVIDRTHPVERVSYADCRETLGLVGLTLPTEAQWEYGARAGTGSPYWYGAEYTRAGYFENHADLSLFRTGSFGGERAPQFDDGFPFTAPVGSFRPNPFGFYDLHGNVSEWCLDAYSENYDGVALIEGTGELLPEDRTKRPQRGGSFKHGFWFQRVSRRVGFDIDTTLDETGLRPARALESP